MTTLCTNQESNLSYKSNQDVQELQEQQKAVRTPREPIYFDHVHISSGLKKPQDARLSWPTEKHPLDVYFIFYNDSIFQKQTKKVCLMERTEC